VLFFERSTVPSSVDDITVATGAAQASANGATAPETTKTTSTTQPASGVTTPPADPAASGTPASTPQGGDAK
jgi:hypothetical protein